MGIVAAISDGMTIPSKKNMFDHGKHNFVLRSLPEIAEPRQSWVSWNHRLPEWCRTQSIIYRYYCICLLICINPQKVTKILNCSIYISFRFIQICSLQPWRLPATESWNGGVFLTWKAMPVDFRHVYVFDQCWSNVYICTMYYLYILHA